MPEPQSLFLSYARGDDEPFVRQLYHDLTARGFTVWWDQQEMPNRGLTFLQEIRDAVEASDRLLAVIGPQAVQSDYVTSEWQHALLYARGVVPLLRQGGYETLPPELQELHAPDFRDNRPYPEALAELLRLLGKPLSPLGPLLTLVPTLPPHFLPRPADFQDLQDLVLADVRRPVAVTSAQRTTGLWGMGGIGKTVLAVALARAADTRRAFPHGVLWLTLGQAADPLPLLRQVGLAFQDEPQYYVELADGKNRLHQILADKVCLLVLDDVWQLEPLEPLVGALGPRCRLLLTTRDAGLVSALEAQELPLDVLPCDAAAQLLAGWVELEVNDLPAAAREVARECGYLPLALALCGALARDGLSWSDLREALQAADLTYIEKELPHYPFPNVFKALQVSVDFLARQHPDRAERYRELAVFPADQEIPEAAVLTLWQHAGGLPAYQARKLLTSLDRSALLKLQGWEPGRLVTLHDLQHDYLRARAGEDLPSLHARLLAAYQAQCPNGWPSGPDDGYFFPRLPYHLLAAGRENELRRLLLDYPWLRAKLAAAGVGALLPDYDLLPGDRALALLQGALRLAAHVLARDPAQLPGQLTGRLLGVAAPDLQDFVAHIPAQEKAPWLRPLTPCLTAPGGPLLRTLAGHTGSVNAVALTADGRQAVSASSDDTIKLWDLETGQEIRTLAGHTGSVNAVALTPDGRTALSASFDHTLKLWDLDSGKEIRTLTGHTGWVNAVALAPDGRTALSASKDETLKCWDLASGRELRTLVGHTGPVFAVALAPDGLTALSTSEDCTLKLWDLHTGLVLRTFEEHSDSVTAVALAPDGRTALSASDDRTLKLWDLHTGRELRTLAGHTDDVDAVALSPDGRTALSASQDETLRLWDLETGQEIRILAGHTDGVDAVALAPDGRTALSASHDGTLKLWDLDAGTELRTLAGHTDWVNAVAVTPDGRRALSASRDQTLKLWDLHTGREIRTLAGPADRVNAVALSPDGRTALSGSLDGTLKLWDLDAGQELRTLAGHTGSVSAVAFTPDGRTALSASHDHTLRLWDLASGRQIRTLAGHTDSVRAVALTPDGRTALSSSAGRTLKLWDLHTGREIRTIAGHEGTVEAVALAPDGRTALSSSWDYTLRLWNLHTGREIRTLTGHTGWVEAVALAPDGRTALSSSCDHTLRLWDLHTGACLDAFTGDGGFMLACALTLDGRTSVAGDASGRVYFLRLENCPPDRP
jgi:WD40 repeat protein